MKRFTRLNNLLFSFTVFAVVNASPVFSDSLPSPLTLEHALSLPVSEHPDLQLAAANLAYATSKRLQAETHNDVDAYFELAPTTTMPTTNDRFLDDSYARFEVTKTVYDFGYSEALETSADEAILSSELIVSDTRNKYHLKIMRQYFDVLLADLHFAAVDEEMTTHYVRYDKLRERQSLDMISEVEVATAENLYRSLADQRKMAELEQQASRQRLAITLNRPDDIPSDLIFPELPQLQREIPELETLLDEALNNNLKLTALEHTLKADKAALKATQQKLGPTVVAGLEMNEYDRKLPGRNTASIGVTLHIPLLNGSRSDAESARAAARLATSQANYDLAKYSIRQNLSDLVRRLQLLQYKRTTDKLRLDGRALKLDKSRARYELEQQTTLGSAMAEYTEAEWLSANNDFEVAITWAQIDILTGKKLSQEH